MGGLTRALQLLLERLPLSSRRPSSLNAHQHIQGLLSEMRPSLPLLLLAGSTAHALRIPRILNDTAAAVAAANAAPEVFETRQPTVAPLLAVAHQSTSSSPVDRQPVLPGDDDAVSILTASASDDDDPAVSVAEGAVKAELQETAGSWKCDVRAWVRAADLEPNSVTEAHARLAANGTACADLESWSVGLRYKQRMITRL